MVRPRARRGGFAVLAVLILLLGLTALAHAALLTSLRERQAGVLEARLTLRRLAARAAATLPSGGDTLPILADGGVSLTPGARGPLRWWTDASALDRELALLTGVAELDGVPGTARTGAVVWRLDPSFRAASAAAVIEHGGSIAGGGASADGWLDAEAQGVAARGPCADELRALDSLGARVPPPLAALPAGGVGPPGLGLLPGDTVLARAPTQLSGAVTPAAGIDGAECVPAPTNWGSPGDPLGFCGARFVHVGAPGDLVVRGGEGQGVLIVRGSLELSDGARFDGVTLVAGDLIIDGARLVGMARVGGAVVVRSGGRVDGSACAVARALRPLQALRAPLLLPGGRVHPL